MATRVQRQEAAPKAAKNANLIEKRKTNTEYIYLIDWYDDGIFREFALVKEAEDGTLFGIEVAKLHPIDKGRLKKFITGTHAGKYELWELLSQGRLANGVNALDFFHSNYVKQKRPRGAVLGGGLATVDLSSFPEEGDSLIGAGFTQGPAEVDRAL